MPDLYASTDNDFATVLREAMDRYGIRMRDLVKRAETCSSSTIYRFMHDHGRMNTENVLELMRICGIGFYMDEPEWLKTEEGARG